jgi:hypothetical protein
MSDKSAKTDMKTEEPNTIMFTCKFCGESKPIAEMIIIRSYFPILAACKECSKGPIVESSVESKS